MLEEPEVFGELVLEAVGREFVQTRKKTPRRESVSMFAMVGPISEDGKKTANTKAMDRAPCCKMGDRPHKRCRKEAQGLRADKRLRDVHLDDWNAKRSVSDSRGEEAAGLQSRFSRLGVG